MESGDLGFTKEQIAEVAAAANRAAVRRVEELGLPDIAAMLGLELASDVAKKTFVLMAILGDESTDLLVDAITAKEASDMQEEAERILKDEH